MREPEDGERIVADNGAQCIWNTDARVWRIYDAAGRFRTTRADEQEAEGYAMRLGGKGENEWLELLK
jgi:hypothetical protein